MGPATACWLLSAKSSCQHTQLSPHCRAVTLQTTSWQVRASPRRSQTHACCSFMAPLAANVCSLLLQHPLPHSCFVVLHFCPVGLSMYAVDMWAEPSSLQGTCQTPAPTKKRLLQSQRNSILFTHKGYRHVHARVFLDSCVSSLKCTCLPSKISCCTAHDDVSTWQVHAVSLLMSTALH